MTETTDTKPPASLAEALARYTDAVLDQGTREGIQQTADTFLRGAIIAAGCPADRCPAEIVGVLLGSGDQILRVVTASEGSIYAGTVLDTPFSYVWLVRGGLHVVPATEPELPPPAVVHPPRVTLREPPDDAA